MRTEVSPHTLLEIAEDFEAAVAWVLAAGFPVDRGRIAEYRQVLRELSASFESSGWGDLNNAQHREKVCTTLLEVRELTSIHRGLEAASQPAAVADLKHYVKGPFQPTDEAPHNASNRPRNFGFELYLNALFAYAGLRPTYGTEADLCFTHDGITFFAEAKRPLTASSAESLIGKANKQLTRRLKDLHSHTARGLLALDLTKVINPENKVMPVYGEDHLNQLMFNEDRRQIDILKEFWHRNRHSRTVGVLLHYRMLTHFLPSGSLNTLKWLGFVQFRDDPALRGLDEKLQAVIRRVC
jgi:hypothetical protein